MGRGYGTVFSAHLSDDGESFARSAASRPAKGQRQFLVALASSRYLRLTVHEASAPGGAVVNELKLRILDRDRMPIGQLERAAQAGRGELYPQSLLGRQVYWTALGEFDQGEQALFDEYGDLEPRRGSPQITPLVRLGGALHGAPGCAGVSSALAAARCRSPSVVWSAEDIELRTTALAHAGQVADRASGRQPRRSRRRTRRWCWRCVPCRSIPTGSTAATPTISAIAVNGARLSVNDRIYAAFSREPDAGTSPISTTETS